MYTLTKLVVIAGFTLGLAGAAVVTRGEAEEPLAIAARQGWATHYSPSAGVGACGWSNNDGEHVGAIGTNLFQKMMVDGNPNHSKACGKMVHLTWHGKSTKVKIVDRCYACGDNDLDLSPAAFQDLAPLATGKLQGVTWKFV
ncbi:hypothetical protein FS749_015033 [Ceratobasidium sp. UAMH 11750]|nr:hypothetical protein FS749_015033 [Ceratobasidium sp. UAMH 11750]